MLRNEGRRLIARACTARPLVARRVQVAHYSLAKRRSPRPMHAKPAPSRSDELPRVAYAEELASIAERSTLLNQTSAPQILNLEDVRPMMATYSSLPSSELTNMVVQKVVASLKQTAKDASYVFRSLPQDERIRLQDSVYQSLRQYLDQVALDVANGSIKNNSAVSQLFRAYEMIDPGAGVVFYENLPDRDLWGGAVIPSMLKTHASFDAIRSVFEKEAHALGGLEFMKPQTVANMTLACVRHGQVEAAEALFNGLMAEDTEVSSGIKQFLIDIFIGDAPAALALSTFMRYPTHIPHHSAMSRLLQRAWQANPDTDEQIGLFSDYLSRLSVPNELSIKPVALTVVANIIPAQATLENATRSIVSLCEAYGNRVAQHELILNIILTQVSQNWRQPDEARDLILEIINNYETENSAVSFRVRLNALENVTGADALVGQLWALRKASGPLQKWDWFALVRATRNGPFFKDEWMAAGQPFQKDVTRFSLSRRY